MSQRTAKVGSRLMVSGSSGLMSKIGDRARESVESDLDLRQERLPPSGK